MGRLFILSGPSGCGKTTLLNALFEEGALRKAPKYSERASRGPGDDIIHVTSIPKSECDVVYVINEKNYGLSLSEIRSLLSGDDDYGIILSDLRVVRRLKRALGGAGRAVYMASPIDPSRLENINIDRHGFSPTPEQEQILSQEIRRIQAGARLGLWNRVGEALETLTRSWRDAMPEARSLAVRAAKIRQFHLRYIDNIALFDHTILNYGTVKQLLGQGREIVCEKWRRASVSWPPVFMVCAAPGSGKGTLMENLNLLGGEEIRIVRKMAKREPSKTDKRDGMIAIGAEGEFPQEFDWRWVFHRSRTEYAVSLREIRDGIQEGRAQIFISNTGQIERAIEELGEHTVLLYLHSTLPEDVLQEHFVRKLGKVRGKQRMESRSEVFESFCHNAGTFDHVLLNTSFHEDLYDQMYRLLDSYSGSLSRRGSASEG